VFSAAVDVCAPTTRGREAVATLPLPAGEFLIDRGTLPEVDRFAEFLPAGAADEPARSSLSLDAAAVLLDDGLRVPPNELSYESIFFNRYAPCGQATEVRYATMT
jgi:hypothetical protein